jgi:hypothetical protein
MAVEQTGKSACWRFPMVHKMVEYPAPRWIIYESDDKAAEINEEQFDPLLRHAPGMAGMLDRKTALKHRYNLPNGSTLDFSGAGADITSKPKRDGVADELDTWPLTEDGISQNLRNFKKRFRTFWRRGEGCLVKVSSPSPRKKGEKQDLRHSVIGDEFDKSRGGYWTLRCLKCKALTMPSHAVHHLQWELTEDDEIKARSLVMVCPSCGHQHRESSAQKMNDRGGYCLKGGTEVKEYTRHMGFQWGALASPRVFSWLDIAQAKMASGSTADMYAQADFDNSWRGIPFIPRRNESHGVKTVMKHCAPMPDPEKLANAFLAADTQDTGWFWVVRGVDAAGNLYRLGNGFVETIQDLERVWDAEYLGLLPVLGIIDEGGHGDMPKHARELIERKQGLYGYKGGAFGERWRHGTVSKQILASAKQYKADLLYYIYSQTDRTQNYWFLPPDPGDEYVEHIAALEPNDRAKLGHRYENWEVPSKDVADHYFDCEKELLCILDVAYADLPANQWRHPVPGMRRSVKQQSARREAPELSI